MQERSIGIGLLGTPSVPEMMRIAQRAETLGYESVWVTETRFTRDAITCASAVAAATSRVRIGTAVVNPVTRGAVLTGVSFATLDELAGGRSLLGIGPGSPHILARQGFGFEQPLVRLRECIEVTRALLRGETVTYAGKTIDVRDVRLDFVPYRPAIPVYLGVTGPRALTLAGEIAEGVLLNGFTSAAYARRARGHIAQGLAAASDTGRSFEVASFIAVSIHEDPDQAKDAIRPLVATYLSNFPNIAREAEIDADLLERIREEFATSGPERAAELVPDEIVDQLTCSGTPDDCRQRIAERRQAGIDLPVIGLAYGDVDLAMEALATA
jgi:5,10-methylenetetrahydromethanopterin reductase